MVAPIQYVVCYFFLLKKKLRSQGKGVDTSHKYQKAGIKIIRGNKMSWAWWLTGLLDASRPWKKCNIPLISCEILDHFNYGI